MSRAAAGESSPGRQHVVNELPNSAVWARSPPREEGWTRHQENGAKPPLMERTGWSISENVWSKATTPSAPLWNGNISYWGSHPSSRGGEKSAHAKLSQCCYA